MSTHQRAHKYKIRSLQKEQVQLVQIEKTLKKILKDIKESINTMKVEELQLKSSLVEHLTQNDDVPTTSAQAQAVADVDVDVSPPSLLWTNTDDGDKSTTKQAPIESLFDENVNKQLLDIETLLVPMKSRVYSNVMEEEEEDDDDAETDGKEKKTNYINGQEDKEDNDDDDDDSDEDFLPGKHC